MTAARPGTVYLVGAGPGDPSLLTVRARELIASADVVVHDGLVNSALLKEVRAGARIVSLGEGAPASGGPLWRRPPGATVRLEARIVEEAQAGRAVVRLYGGDPLIFGRGGEEALALAAAGIPFELVPGITSAVAAFASAGIPVTHRDLASAVVFASALEGVGAPVDWGALARIGTVVLYMAEQDVAGAAARLREHGRPADDPVVAVQAAGGVGQRVLDTTLDELPARWDEAGLSAPAVIIAGPAAALRGRMAWRERLPLHGRTVAVTRPAHQSAELVSALEALGAGVIRAPAIAQTDPGDPAPLAAALGRLAVYDLVVFTSPNAVAYVFAALERLELDARAFAGCEVAAVGTATAQALALRGLRADRIPDRQDGDGLLAALAGTLAGRRILVPRAEEGRERFPSGARAEGASVDVVTAYRTVGIPAAADLLRPHLEAGRLDAIALTSPSQLRALLEGLGDDAVPLLRKVLLACIGDTTLAAVEAAGLTGAAPGHFAIEPLVALIVERLGAGQSSP